MQLLLQRLIKEASNLATNISKTHYQVARAFGIIQSEIQRSSWRPSKVQTFNVEDLVMVHLRKEWYPIGTYNKLKNKKLGTFCIIQQYGPKAYQLELPKDLKISSTFNVIDLHDYHPLDATPTCSSLLMVNLSHDKGEWWSFIVDQKPTTLNQLFYNLSFGQVSSLILG